MPLTADDRMAMADLIARYNRSVDAGDGEAFGDVFTDDATLDLSGNVIRGRSDLVAFAGQPRPTRHLAGNQLIDAGASDDEARGSCTVVVVGLGADAPAVLVSGIYDDVFRRVGGEWRIASRTFKSDAAG